MREAMSFTACLLALVGASFANVTTYYVGPGDLASGKPEFSAPHGTGTNPFAYDWDSAAPTLGVIGAPGFHGGSWYASVSQAGATQADRYRTFRVGLRDLFGYAVEVDDIVGISYYTNKDAPQTAIDWRLTIYTETQSDGGDRSSWYRSRIQTRTSSAANLNAPANAWNLWDTDENATNSLRFYDTTRTGFSNASFVWDDIAAGSVTANANSWDYSSEKIMMMDFTLGANSGGGTGASYLDGIQIMLANGDTARIDIVPAPGAALLALIGMPIVGWVKRRMA